MAQTVGGHGTYTTVKYQVGTTLVGKGSKKEQKRAKKKIYQNNLHKSIHVGASQF